jgi:hypothetical protein
MAQFSSHRRNWFGSANNNIFEVVMLADASGNVITPSGGHPISNFAAIDNYDDAGSNIGWKFQDDWIPAFGIRVKPGSGTEFHLIDFSITLNGGTSVVAGYRFIPKRWSVNQHKTLLLK